MRRPGSGFNVTTEDVGELRTLVRRLFNTPPQSVDAAWARSKLVANLSGNRQIRSSGHYQFARSPVAGNDLSDHVGHLARAASLWFEGGEAIPPVLAERVQLFLRRSGHLPWERAFLAVFCYHFAIGHDGRYDGLTARAAELRVYPLPRRRAVRRAAAYRAAPRDGRREDAGGLGIVVGDFNRAVSGIVRKSRRGQRPL
ncbi:MAG: hypothetical protein ABI377_07365 [Devosia sp.]